MRANCTARRPSKRRVAGKKLLVRITCSLPTDTGKRTTRDVVADAIAANNKAHIQQLRCSPDTRLCNHAATLGHLDALRALHRQNHRPDIHTALLAAEHGHLHVLKWLRRIGCPMDNRVAEHGCWNGHLSVARWVVSVGLPIDLPLCLAMTQFDYPSIYKWLDRLPLTQVVRA